MSLRLVGLALTSLAVVVLLVSLVLGLRAPAPHALDPDTTARPAPSDRVVRVEVLNAAGLPGIARDVTDFLRDRGFDVVYYGNASGASPDSTTVLDRAGNPAATARVAEILGIDRIETAIDTTLYLEATVVLGVDWPEISDRAGLRR